MAAALTELPKSFPALWRSIRLGYSAEPRLIVASFVTTVGAAVPDALLAVALSILTGAVVAGHDELIVVAVIALGALALGNWLLSVASERINLVLSERVAVHIESYVARLQSSAPSLEHHERPDFLDRLTLLRDHAAALSPLYRSLFITIGAMVRLVLTIAFLISARPVLGLLALFAVPTVLVSNRRAAAEKIIEEQSAQGRRLARHLFVLGTTPGPGKEIRVGGLQQWLPAQWVSAWTGAYLPLIRARWTSAWWQAGSWVLFGLAFVASVGAVALGPHASAARVTLVLAAGSRLSQYAGRTATETHFLRSIWLDASRRLFWLEDYVAALNVRAENPALAEIREGIEFSGVSFTYPGADRQALTDVSLVLPAGKVIAIVGENGAGKSTLVKLLCRFYEPTSGEITVDRIGLASITPDSWRARLAGAFQDFFKFEYRVQHTIGLGDVARLDDRDAAETAVDRAGARDTVSGLSSGYETQLGVTWHDGVELSQGQWQKLALARGFMRDEPLLVVLDEPTASLDAETEHSLFERYAVAGHANRARTSGTITILVSHRFSTVRMADLIVVLDGSRVVEHGSHSELMRSMGKYAELYGIQAAAYR